MANLRVEESVKTKRYYWRRTTLEKRLLGGGGIILANSITSKQEKGNREREGRNGG
jgi:hypothetical protein